MGAPVPVLWRHTSCLGLLWGTFERVQPDLGFVIVVVAASPILTHPFTTQRHMAHPS